MRINQRLVKNCVVAFFLLAFGFAPLSRTLAQQGGSGIQVSPTKSELTIEPGKSETVKISLRNTTSGDVVAKPVINDFYSDNETGEPRLIVDNTERSPFSVESLISGLEDVDLKAGETKELQLFISVPTNQPSGAYYGAIRFNAVSKAVADELDENLPQVSLIASVGVLLLVEVPGDIVEKLELTSVRAYLADKPGTFFTTKPLQIGVSVKNLGNGYARPFGKVTLENPLGRQVANYEMNGTNPRGNVLPESSRTFFDGISGAVTWPGRYTITANISHGRGGEVLSISSSFWYLPLWFAGSVALLLLVLVLLMRWVYRRYISRSVTRRR